MEYLILFCVVEVRGKLLAMLLTLRFFVNNSPKFLIFIIDYACLNTCILYN